MALGPGAERVRARGAGETVEDGGLQQETAEVLGLTLQDLFDQVVDDVAVVARESADEPGNVIAAPHRERGQLEASDPALGPRFEGGDILRLKVQAHHLTKERGRLVGGETQIGCA